MVGLTPILAIAFGGYDDWDDPGFRTSSERRSKNNKDNQTDYTANSRQAFADIARESFSNSVNIPPTLYKNQGEIITLIVGQDLDFSKIYKLKMK